ncbi:MAG: hypothetical protein AAF908_11655, partial [Pseudomonadota bacterium]
MAHPLSGADIATLAAVMRDGGGADRWQDRAAIWGAVLGRAPISGLEHLFATPGTPSRREMEPPVFILGH